MINIKIDNIFLELNSYSRFEIFNKKLFHEYFLMKNKL